MNRKEQSYFNTEEKSTKDRINEVVEYHAIKLAKDAGFTDMYQVEALVRHLVHHGGIIAMKDAEAIARENGADASVRMSINEELNFWHTH